MLADHANLEAAFVGSLLLRDDALFEIPSDFTAAALGNSVARSAYEAIGRLSRAKKPVDLRLVAADARMTPPQVEWLQEAIAAGTTNSPAPYAEELLDRHRRNTAIVELTKAIEAVRGGREDVSSILGGLSARLGDVTGGEPDWHSFREVNDEALEAMERGELVQPIATGFPSIDAAAPFCRSDLIVLAAQTGQGKSTLALNIADNVARRGGHVLMHSFEMSRHQLWTRLAARASRFTVSELLERGNIHRVQGVQAATYALADGGYPLLMNCGKFSLGAILHSTEKAHRKHGLSLAVVDYLGLTEVDDPKLNDEAKLAMISRALKQLAMRLNIPVVLVAQLNREADKRQEAGRPKAAPANDKAAPKPLPAPRSSDLRGSGRIGQDANLILLLHHPWAQSKDPRQKAEGPFQLIVAKSRMGTHATIELLGRLQFAEFLEMPKRDPIWGGVDGSAR